MSVSDTVTTLVFAHMTHIVISTLHAHFQLLYMACFSSFFSSVAFRLFLCLFFVFHSAATGSSLRLLRPFVSSPLRVLSLWQQLSPHRDGAAHAMTCMHETTPLCDILLLFRRARPGNMLIECWRHFTSKPLQNPLFKLWWTCRLQADWSRYSYRHTSVYVWTWSRSSHITVVGICCHSRLLSCLWLVFNRTQIKLSLG